MTSLRIKKTGMAKKYAVDLNDAERALLNELINSGTQRVRKTNRARILLKAEAGWTDQAIAEALDVSLPTIKRPRKRTNLFMFFAPLHNWRHVKVTQHRTKRDWAFCIRDLLYEHFPQAERCLPVQDNHNIHDPAGLYEVFPPAQAKSMLDRLEFHFTPKHSRWLNMAEIEHG